jgi:radical SAM superfamily enzyme YgiQ (UPF0313 family)|tara:strand:+ start:21209 stop:22720 length:1512 start_codon:yes stop_codon:yes gene_type:complete
MNILLFNVPSRGGSGGFTLPLGLLYVGGTIERCNHKVKIVDLYLEQHKGTELDLDKIKQIINQYNPSIVGYGGIATSYGRTKKLSAYLKTHYPHITQIVGGALSSVYELLLKKTSVDVVFHGEAEVSLPEFLERVNKKESFYKVQGISYLQNGKVVRNPPAEQIKDIDIIPLPAYHLVDIPTYLSPIKGWIDIHKLQLKSPHYANLANKIGDKDYYISMVTARGCTNRCSFCYRHVKGVRQNSVDYVIKHIEYLKKNYRIKGFKFNDELFNSNRDWVMELCDAIEKNNPDICYIVGGARVDKIDEEMLYRLKDTGCIAINYGQESGSDKILKEYRKGVTRQKNVEITNLTNKIGVFNVVQLVIGSPGETTDTIFETIQFLKEVNSFNYSVNYLIPLPETPIWKYVEKNELIEDVEKYLDSVAQYGGTPIVNLTKESDKVWKSWDSIIRRELKLHYYGSENRTLFYYSYKLLNPLVKKLYPLIRVFSPLIPFRIKKSIADWVDL